MFLSKSYWRFRWHALALAACITIPGWVTVAMLPDKWEATAQLYIQADSPMEVLRDQLPAGKTSFTALDLVRVSSMSKQDLNSVIRAANATRQAAARGVGDGAADRLLERIQIHSAAQWDSLFRITFEDADRQHALAVIEAFVETVVTQATNGRDSRNRGTFDEDRGDAAPSVRIIEAAELDAVPALSNGSLWVWAILAIGLAAGAGFAYWLEVRRPVFDVGGRVAAIGDFPVIGVVRHARMSEMKARQRHEVLMYGIGSGALLLCFAIALLI